MGPRSPLRFGRCRTDVPRTSCNPSSARLRLLRGRRPWVQGLRFASVGAEQTSHRTSCGLRSASVVAEQTSHRTSCGLRSASVVAEQTSPGRLATHLPQGFGCCVAGANGSRSRLRTPSSMLKWGKLNYTDFVQNCILDQKERTSL